MYVSKSPLRGLLAGLALVAVAAGCGSSSPAAATKDPNPAATQAAVDGFCTASKALTAQITAGVTAANATAINASVQALNTQSKTITDVNSWATDGVNACMTDALAALQKAGLVPKTGGGASTTTVKGATSTTTGGTSKGTTTVAGGGGSTGNADVDAFCKQAGDLATKLKAAVADPTKATDLAALEKDMQDLTTKATALITTNPKLAPAVQACVKKLTDAVVPLSLPTTIAPPATTVNASATTTGGAAPSGDVAAFCKSVDDLIAQIQPIMNDPTKASQLAVLMTQLQTLAAQAVTLAQKDPSQADAISTCLNKLSALG